jgi:carbohydrate diacid regulator
MNNLTIKSRLEQLLDVPLSVSSSTESEWNHLREQADRMDENYLSLVLDGVVYFRWNQGGNQIQLLSVEEDRLKGAERSLIEWILESAPVGAKDTHITRSTASEEQKAVQLGEWIAEQLDVQYKIATDQDIPDSMTLKSRLLSNMIPILLVSEHPHPTHTSYLDLYKLLKSYFGGEVYLIPLQEKEWLILCPEELIFMASADDREEDSSEKPEETLGSFCEGLYELLSSEWLGECHVAISHPVVPARMLLSTVALLRETVYLGRAFHVTSNIHLPWMLHMERLINSIPDGERRHFMDRVLARSDVFMDPETLTTLETFFSLDCNVSDTAKKLYIHRNTLLYRLDKIKQETGLDVRTFGDAVLVKLILLLYKVTKRK